MALKILEKNITTIMEMKVSKRGLNDRYTFTYITWN